MLPSVVGALVAMTCLVAYLELAEDFKLSPAILAFDVRVSALVQSWRTPPLTRFFEAVTWSASWIPVAVVTVAVVVALLWLARYAEAVLAAAVVAVGSVLGFVAKRVTLRPRPPIASALIGLPTSFSFPSGHSLSAILLGAILVVVVWRSTTRRSIRWAAVALGLAVAILTGLSRIYLGVHWPSDVLASWLLGTGWLALCLGALLTWERMARSRC